jgi:glycosyltransferase involved in cell wall biosynthesis
MKRIGIIHLSGSIGGGSVSCYNLVRSLESNYEVVVFCPSEPQDFTLFLKEKKINVVNITSPIGGVFHYSGGPSVFNPAFFKKIYQMVKHGRKIENQIRKEKIDLIIANSLVIAWMSKVARSLKIPSICFVRETMVGTPVNIWNVLNKKYLNQFNAVSFLSNYDLNMFSVKTKAVVIPDYIDCNENKTIKSKEQLCEEYGIPFESFKILYVGGMTRIKGIHTLIKSLKYLKKYNFNLVIAGNSLFQYDKNNKIISKIYNHIKKMYSNRIEKEVNKFNLEENITKVGIQKDMTSFYNLADVVVFPANVPHQSRPAFEAGFQHKTIVLTNFENTKEFIYENWNGLYFENKNPKDLANVIEKLIIDPIGRRYLEENNYKNAMSRHTGAINNPKISKLIKEIL